MGLDIGLRVAGVVLYLFPEPADVDGQRIIVDIAALAVAGALTADSRGDPGKLYPLFSPAGADP